MKLSDLDAVIEHVERIAQSWSVRPEADASAALARLREWRENMEDVLRRYERIKVAAQAAARDSHNQNWAMWTADDVEDGGAVTVVYAVEEMESILSDLALLITTPREER